jgi:hypothetical protein
MTPEELAAIREHHADYERECVYGDEISKVIADAACMPKCHADRAALLAHVEQLERDRDEAQINAEKFRQSMYAVEKDALRLQTESDALRAELAEAKRELALRKKPLSYPGDEAAVKESGLPPEYCNCTGGGDDPHKPYCDYWNWILTARKMWHQKHVVAWSCKREATGHECCKQWCGNQRFCTASTRDAIDAALKDTP